MTDLGPAVNDGADASLRKVVGLLNLQTTSDFTFYSKKLDTDKLILADPLRKFLLIQNLSDTYPLKVRFDGTVLGASATPSMLLPISGGGIVFEGTTVYLGQISFEGNGLSHDIFTLVGTQIENTNLIFGNLGIGI